MIEETPDITTTDGEMETFICRPERGGSFPAVFLLMDAPGIREELRDMARRLATVGYYVLLPNLYYRAGRDTIFGPGVLEDGSAERERMRAVRTKMTIPPVMNDVAALFGFIDRQSEVKQGQVGCHGYCMSGPYALAAAARYPDRFAAAASFTVPGSSTTPRKARTCPWTRSKENSISPAPSTTRWRPCRWSRSCALYFNEQVTPARSNSIPASIMALPSHSALIVAVRPVESLAGMCVD